VCKFLLENPAVDMDCATATGCTALFLAAQQKRKEVADYLLRQGADASKAEDGMGYTAMDVARMCVGGGRGGEGAGGGGGEARERSERKEGAAAAS
jgi:hypothetical protein